MLEHKREYTVFFKSILNLHKNIIFSLTRRPIKEKIPLSFYFAMINRAELVVLLLIIRHI